MCHMLLLAQTFTRRRICSYIRTHVCDASHGLLQHHACWDTRVITDKLHWVLNAAAHTVTGAGKYNRGLCHLLHTKLHWLDVPQRVQLKLRTTVHRCLQNKTSQYLVDCCTPVSDITSLQHLRFASCHQLFMPWHWCLMFGCQAFSVAHPTACNLLPDSLRDPAHSPDCFQQED